MAVLIPDMTDDETAKPFLLLNWLMKCRLEKEEYHRLFHRLRHQT